MFAKYLSREKLSYVPHLNGDKLRQVSIFPSKMDSRLCGNDKQKVQTCPFANSSKTSQILLFRIIIIETQVVM